MFKEALNDSLNIKNLIDTWKYKKEFKKEHPYFFDPIGTMIFCGSQGKGKTLSAVNYLINVTDIYGYAIIVTNVEITERPFNTRYQLLKDGTVELRDLVTDELVTQESILDGTHKNVCIEYDGLDTLKYVSNGELGVIYLIDELHLELNSLESKNIDIDVMTEISQQRKQRKHIVGTSQVYMRLAKPLREQIFNVILCNNFFHCIQFNKSIDGETATEKDGKLNCEVKSRHIFFHSPRMYQRYDTYAKMKRYNKEWKGHKRETPIYQNVIERSEK